MTFTDGLLIGVASASLLALAVDYFLFKAYAKFANKKLVEAYNKGVEDMRDAYKVEFKKRADAITKSITKDSSVTYDKPVTVATGGICGNGHTRMQLGIDGITFGGKAVPAVVPLRNNFEGDSVGRATLSLTDEAVQAKLDVRATIHNKAGQDLYPAIGGNVLESHEVDGILFIDRFEITEVSLCTQPNADPAIKSLREQFNAQAVGQLG